MIIIAPFIMDDGYGRVLKYMANVWIEYNMFSFDTHKYRWDHNEKLLSSISRLYQYTKFIQEAHGQQLTVLFVMDGVEVPFDIYYSADIVIKYNRASMTYRFLRDAFTDRNSNTVHSSAFVANVLRTYMFGADNGNN